MHGAGGELRVEGSRVAWPVLDLVARAAQEDGLPLVDDFNRGDNEGVGPLHVTQKNGVRWSASRAFLKPALRRANLQLECEALTQRVLFEGRRAVGVEYRRSNETRMARARREVILAAGAITTPQILMLSGVGPAAHLAERGIAALLDKPGVGGNLQDHLQMRVSYRLEGVADVQPALQFAVRKDRHRARICRVPFRADDDGADHPRHFRKDRSAARTPQYRIQRAALLADRAAA